MEEKKNNLISIIVPCYNEQEAIPFFYKEIIKVASEMTGVDMEIILVDDGSADGTLSAFRMLAEQDTRVRYISFSRNFGKEAAMFAGLQSAKGDYVAIMDADLQDPPSLLPEMYRIVKEEGYDSVATRRSTRKGEPPVRTFFANVFYKLINKISKVELVPGARDYRLMNRKMVDAVLSVTEYNRFSKGIFQWVGYKTKWLSYENIERVAGTTKWSFWKLFKYALESIIAFSTTPLSVSSFFGFLFCLLSVIGIIVVIVRQAIWGGSAYGWASMVCIILFVGGVQLFCIGILGQYLSKTYLETKKRPIYIVAETERDNKKEAD
ncbi:MAG: glycosyltransferase family 2 protein [Eubacteriales bacterium]|nr:glycosyltransferase family 2 protein [Eubacteriales bacterium]MDD4422148.1 glycosyltransferase family 2 protein [Eubacteriales bacterium]HBR31217.1 glycosyltransferase [Clostridiales bacterium]